MNPMITLLIPVFLLAALLNTAGAQEVRPQEKPQAGDPLEGRVIVVDPGHGGTAGVDDYRVGPDGEREEWINLRVALLLQEMLEERGAKVIMTRTEDVAVELAERARLVVENEADAFVSVHHNATADPGVNFPIVYFHGNASENRASVLLARAMADRMNQYLFDGKAPVSVVSDHAIFPTAGTSVLRHSYGIPGVIVEASFFTNPEEEQRLRDPEYNRLEAEAHVMALEDFFYQRRPEILEKYSTVQLPPFEVLQEAGRMAEEARLWKQDYLEGKRLMESDADLERALELLTRSVRSFPDSWVAGKAHAARAEIMQRLGKKEDAETIRRRVTEFYVVP
jgi:N-acetylmuramoyl-L-alanine amidase